MREQAEMSMQLLNAFGTTHVGLIAGIVNLLIACLRVVEDMP